MAENETKPADQATGQAAEQATPPRLKILSQYIRDLSFENIAVQKGVKVEGTPEIQVKVALDARKHSDTQFEVVVKVGIESKSQDQTVFLMEMDYAGQFLIENVPSNQLHPFLLIECPRMLFPFLRRVVSDVTRDGGYPPLNIDNIDFLALYRQNLAQQQQQKESGPSGTA